MLLIIVHGERDKRSFKFGALPVSISLVLLTLIIMPMLVACWISSSTCDCMLLVDVWLRNSVSVVSSTCLWVISDASSPLISIVNVNGPRYDPWGIPVMTGSQSDSTSSVLSNEAVVSAVLNLRVAGNQTSWQLSQEWRAGCPLRYLSEFGWALWMFVSPSVCLFLSVCLSLSLLHENQCDFC